ncbi:tyrosine-type recombinase/integrase [Aquirufa ecclesiirivi]|uniref:tyrosine-type recombinase/integrase n=1 Tax=Aquirufa ecclesiirivi TaxID=2715124 RepID=UPI0022A8CE81|nr:tyrosine-type recombinase/integrase [Aquirufa ecclesiirivi]MCZ2472978.1 tyrosine-type recombinase/integrase [Aquirufa ecclesiirivi]
MNSDVVNFFLEHLSVERRCSPHTIISYATDLKQFSLFLEEQHQSLPLTEVSSSQIRLWLVHLSDNSLENRSINRKLASLRTFYKFLLQKGRIQENPLLHIRTIKTRKKLPQFLRESEMAEIPSIDETNQDFGTIRDQLILYLLYGTGMRLAELISLQKSHINLSQATLRVLGKRNKERIIPIPAFLLQLIQRYLTLCPFESLYLIVDNKGKQVYPMMVQRLIKKQLGEISTLEKLSPHVLRHTYATHLLNNGADLNAIKELLGHANLAATQVYTHNSMEKIKEIYAQAHPKA